MSAPDRVVRLLATALAIASIALSVRAAATRADLSRVMERTALERSASAHTRSAIVSTGLDRLEDYGDPRLLLDSLLAGFVAPDDARDLMSRLSSAAAALGVGVDSVDGGPAGREGRMSVAGDPAGVIAWLHAAEREVIESGAVFRTLSVRPAGADVLAVTVAVAHPDSAGTPVATSTADRSAIFNAAAAWPAAPVERVARALTPVPDTTRSEADPGGASGFSAAHAAAGSDTRADVPSPPRFVGTVGTGSPNYVFRFDESGVVRALTPGDRAYGWRLVEADRALFVFEHEGETYEAER